MQTNDSQRHCVFPRHCEESIGEEFRGNLLATTDSPKREQIATERLPTCLPFSSSQ